MDSVLSMISSHKENLKARVEMKKVSAALRDNLLEALKSGGTYSSFVPFFEAFDEWASDKQPSVQKRMIVDVVRAAYSDMLEFLNMDSEELRLYELAMQIYDGYVEYRIERDDRFQSYVFRATTVTVLAAALFALYANQKLQWLLKRAGSSGVINLKLIASRFGYGGIEDGNEKLKEVMLEIVRHDGGFEKKVFFMHHGLSKMSSEQRMSIAHSFIDKMRDMTIDVKNNYKALNELQGSLDLETKIPTPVDVKYKNKRPFLQRIQKLQNDMKHYRGAVTLCNVNVPSDVLTEYLDFCLKGRTWKDMWITDWISQLEKKTNTTFDVKLSNFKPTTESIDIYRVRDKDIVLVGDTAGARKIGFTKDLMHIVVKTTASTYKLTSQAVVKTTASTYKLTSTQAIDLIVSVLSEQNFKELELSESVKSLLWEYIVNFEAMRWDFTTFDHDAFMLYLSIKERKPDELELHKNDIAAQKWLSTKIVKSSEQWIKDSKSLMDKKTRKNLESVFGWNQTD